MSRVTEEEEEAAECGEDGVLYSSSSDEERSSTSQKLKVAADMTTATRTTEGRYDTVKGEGWGGKSRARSICQSQRGVAVIVGVGQWYGTGE